MVRRLESAPNPATSQTVMANVIHKLIQLAKTIPLVAAVTLLVCCQNKAHIELVDTLGTAIDAKHLTNHFDPRLEAPIIVVGLVEENRAVVRHVQAARYPGVYLDLHEVRCKLENLLKGTLNGSELEFFYYAQGEYPDSKWNPRYKRLFQANPRSRYFFFLTREGDKLRSIGDVGEFSASVLSGAHNTKYSEEQDVGRRLSELLLTPGEGANTAKMAEALSRESNIADVWGSRVLSVQLLRNLFSLGEPLRAAACGTLAGNYYGQDDCLRTVAADASTSEQVGNGH